jgi:hypothetical protein
MHILNKFFQKVFVITTGCPNERYEYISSYLNRINLNFELRVSVNKSFFTTKIWLNHEMNQSEQSLSSIYASIFYENYFNKIDSFVVLEDDNIFCDEFESKFQTFFQHLPNEWDVLHLGDYNLKENIKSENVNEYVDKIYLKYTTNCMVFRNIENYKIIAEMIDRSQYQIDYVLNHFYINNILKCYSPVEQLTNQLSYRKGIDSVKKFESLIRSTK